MEGLLFVFTIFLSIVITASIESSAHQFSALRLPPYGAAGDAKNQRKQGVHHRPNDPGLVVQAEVAPQSQRPLIAQGQQ